MDQRNKKHWCETLFELNQLLVHGDEITTYLE